MPSLTPAKVGVTKARSWFSGRGPILVADPRSSHPAHAGRPFERRERRLSHSMCPAYQARGRLRQVHLWPPGQGEMGVRLVGTGRTCSTLGLGRHRRARRMMSGLPTCPRCGIPVEETWDWCHGCGYDPDGMRPADASGAGETTIDLTDSARADDEQTAARRARRAAADRPRPARRRRRRGRRRRRPAVRRLEAPARPPPPGRRPEPVPPCRPPRAHRPSRARRRGIGR